jgi:hypothetical protein
MSPLRNVALTLDCVKRHVYNQNDNRICCKIVCLVSISIQSHISNLVCSSQNRRHRRWIYCWRYCWDYDCGRTCWLACWARSGLMCLSDGGWADCTSDGCNILSINLHHKHIRTRKAFRCLYCPSASSRTPSLRHSIDFCALTTKALVSENCQ